MSSAENTWPELNWLDWSATGDTLHRWMQIVGKVRMALTPRINHWWNVTLYVTPRGLTTGAIHHGSLTFAIAFDFIDHVLLIDTSAGATEKIKLAPMTVAEFYALVMA